MAGSGASLGRGCLNLDYAEVADYADGVVGRRAMINFPILFYQHSVGFSGNEKPFDAIGITNADLNVVLLTEPGTRI